MQQQTPPEPFDKLGMVADLNNLLRLKTTVIGMKMFARVEEMTAIPKIRRPIVGMKQLSKNGLRYPIAPYGIQNDVRAGMGASYAKT
jgi:hypothetical protein